MLIAVRHVTRYRYETAPEYALQRLRLTPRTDGGQTARRWRIAVDGGRTEAEYDDHFDNRVTLVGAGGGARDIVVTCEGEVETTDAAGVVGPHRGCVPLWYFRRATALTRPGPRIRRLAAAFAGADDGDLGRLHGLARAVAGAMPWETERTHAATAAERALEAGAGVCQDHAHVFLGAARAMGFPARYASGYMATDDGAAHEAAHGWAEAHVDGLGWVGFDVSNGISPDERHVRIAVGLDYGQAAPVTGIRFGDGAAGESMRVAVSAGQ